MKLRSFSVAVLVATVALTGVSILGTAAEPAKKPVSLESRISKLQQERLEVLEYIVKAETVAFQQGVGTADAVIRARLQLHDAQLEAATEHKERVNILAARLQHLLELEATTKKRVDVAIADRAEFMKVRSLRLKAEIDLLTEQGKG